MLTSASAVTLYRLSEPEKVGFMKNEGMAEALHEVLEYLVLLYKTLVPQIRNIQNIGRQCCLGITTKNKHQTERYHRNSFC